MTKRTSEHVSIIDDFIRKNFPEYGPDFCAEQLGEPRSYIQNRAWYLKVKKKKTTAKKYNTKNPNWKTKYTELRRSYKQLRLEMIRVIHENKRLKTIVDYRGEQ